MVEELRKEHTSLTSTHVLKFGIKRLNLCFSCPNLSRHCICYFPSHHGNVTICLDQLVSEIIWLYNLIQPLCPHSCCMIRPSNHNEVLLSLPTRVVSFSLPILLSGGCTCFEESVPFYARNRIFSISLSYYFGARPTSLVQRTESSWAGQSRGSTVCSSLSVSQFDLAVCPYPKRWRRSGQASVVQSETLCLFLPSCVTTASVRWLLG